MPFFIAKFGRFMHRFNFLLVQTNNVIEKKTWLNLSPPSFACRGEICGVGWSDIALLVVFRSDIFLWVQIKKISFFWCACTIALLTRGKIFIDKMNNFLWTYFKQKELKWLLFISLKKKTGTLPRMSNCIIGHRHFRK